MNRFNLTVTEKIGESARPIARVLNMVNAYDHPEQTHGVPLHIKEAFSLLIPMTGSKSITIETDSFIYKMERQ